MSSFTTLEKFEHILTSSPAPGVALITLNRPKALNALCSPLIVELNKALKVAEEDDAVGAVVVTGSEKAFAGACQCTELACLRYYEYNEEFVHDQPGRI